ncbi:unnamed protein product [Urochloa decumbens]|uniref:F-box domain-containing protein n=1 Tax=Urochloa decumbens TaxID=240449 RepID=A0ABC8XMC1_9POAL
MADAALSAYDEWIARREAHIRLCAAGGEDRLGELPEDILRLILQRLDTRTALATAALSKRWARLPRELPVLEFKVGDVLPERYRRHRRRRADAQLDSRKIRKLDELIGRYERQAMRSLASSVSSFLGAPDTCGRDDDDGRRRAQSVILELFPTHNSGPFNRLIAKAISDWGIQDLEILVLKPTTPSNGGIITYRFPHHCFEESTKSSPAGSLKRLSLINCAPLTVGSSSPPPRAFSSLAVLVLQAMPKSSRLYQRVIRACPMLEVLHLKSCLFRGKVSIDAPESRITELVMDACTFKLVKLGTLPKLQRLAWSGAPVVLIIDSLPLLTHLHLSFYDDPNAGPDPQYAAFFGARDEYSALNFSSRFSSLENLVVRFTGPEMWFVAPELRVPFGNLRRLILADMPRSWDISWTCRLLEAAPFLDTLHAHVADDNSWETAFGPAIPEPPSCFKHHALREVVILGFQGTATQLHFVRFLKDACKALKNVALFKRGHIQCEGFWNWKVVASTVECQWSDEERDVLLREINGGTNNIASSTTQIVLR